MTSISRLAAATLTVLSAFSAFAPLVLAKNRELQVGKGYDVGKGYNVGGNNNRGSCSGPLIYFQSEVLVDFDGFDTDVNDLTRIRWEELEKGFRQSYNVLSKDLCDKSNTRVVDVAINKQPDGEVLIRRGGNQYSLSYTVEAVCRGCDPSTVTLFSPPSVTTPDYVRKLISSDGTTIGSADENPLDSFLQRRRAKSEKSSKKEKSSGKGSKSYYGKGGKGSGIDDANFDCGCETRNPKKRAPTEEEFVLAYGAEIRETERPHSRRHGGIIVDKVLKVTEIQDVSCSIVTETFQSIVAIEFFWVLSDCD